MFLFQENSCEFLFFAKDYGRYFKVPYFQAAYHFLNDISLLLV